MQLGGFVIANILSEETSILMLLLGTFGTLVFLSLGYILNKKDE